MYFMTFFYLFAALVEFASALRYSPPAFLDFQQLSACAHKCEIIQDSEKNCVAPVAPFSNNATYLDCLCQSEYLRSLHNSGEIC
jgi:hypothetical protein